MLPMKKADSPQREESFDAIVGKGSREEKIIVTCEQTSNLFSKHISHFLPTLGYTATFKSSTPVLTSSNTISVIFFQMSSTIISHFSFESICVNNICIAIIKLFFSLVSLYKKKHSTRLAMISMFEKYLVQDLHQLH